jgi:hypothetical protein
MSAVERFHERKFGNKTSSGDDKRAMLKVQGTGG